MSRSLSALRKRKGLSQIEAAAKAGITQSMLSRAENGRALLDPAVLRRLASGYGATPAERTELLESAAAIAPGRMDSRLVMQRGDLTRLHDRIYAIEQQTAVVRSYQPGAVLGVLQTRRYTEAIFTAGGRSPEEVAELVDNRQRRNQLMLEESKREWLLIQTVGALDWNIGGPAVMIAQLERLAQSTGLPNVRLGIVDRKTPVRFFAPHGFHLYDERAVLVGTATATGLSDNQAEIDEYRRTFAELDAVAVYDGEARELLSRIADEYRALR